MLTGCPLPRSCSVENTRLSFLTLCLLPLPGTPTLTVPFKARQHLAGLHPAGALEEGSLVALTLEFHPPAPPVHSGLPQPWPALNLTQGHFLYPLQLHTPSQGAPATLQEQPGEEARIPHCAAKTQSWPMPKVNHMVPVGPAPGDPPLGFGWTLRNPRHEDVCVPGRRKPRG